RVPRDPPRAQPRGGQHLRGHARHPRADLGPRADRHPGVHRLSPMRLPRWIVVLAVIYVAAYAIFRQTRIEVWEKDKQASVIFPESAVWIYYAFRPLTLVDEKLTGMRFHIGPHR